MSSGLSRGFSLIAGTYRRANRSVLVKRIELITNGIIVITSVLLCVVLIKNYFLSKPIQSTQQRTVTQAGVAPNKLEGTKISLPGVDWTMNGHTVILALSTTCHFCSESASFYKQITQLRADNVGVIAVLPQSQTDSNNYFKELGVSVDSVLQAPLNSLGVKGTPTLILIDRSGVIVGSWRGKLLPHQEADVIARVR